VTGRASIPISERPDEPSQGFGGRGWSRPTLHTFGNLGRRLVKALGDYPLLISVQKQQALATGATQPGDDLSRPSFVRRLVGDVRLLVFRATAMSDQQFEEIAAIDAALDANIGAAMASGPRS
jgi:hypothetical protein